MCPDITMCSGKGCPLKDSCYRYTAPRSEYQSFFLSPPFKTVISKDAMDGYHIDHDKIRVECEHYWPAKE